MPAATGSDILGTGTAAVAVVAAISVVCEYDGGVSVALKLAALSTFVLLLRYAGALYGIHLLATLSPDDDDLVPPPAARSDDDDDEDGVTSGLDDDGVISGLDDDAIARLPACFVVASSEAGAGAMEDCAVCLGAVEEGETARALPCCAHAFHARCVDAWLRLRPTCPVCRATCR